uniref:Uncharacterized protein n=1 Tax=Thermosporothrix sp. COM3 TaxID=2490863 RepID=A0A455SIP2_9CHLR|nr:hypothetical protein KTC_19420 [Thermosporothrix sp. COM3]
MKQAILVETNAPLTASQRLMAGLVLVLSGSLLVLFFFPTTLPQPGTLRFLQTVQGSSCVEVTLQALSPPHHQYFLWLLPEKGDDTRKAILLGSSGQTVHLKRCLGQRNLLASYSRVLVTDEEGGMPTAPTLDSRLWRYEGAFPDTAGGQRFSALDHLRHLLAEEPTLKQLGLDGGFALYLQHNAARVDEWSRMAQQAHEEKQIRQFLYQSIQYLDGTAFAWKVLPPGTPVFVGSEGRLGLLEEAGQELPGYLNHIREHVRGMSEAPGVSVTQHELALHLDDMIRSELIPAYQQIRGHVLALLQMETLGTPEAREALAQLAATAHAAYAGNGKSGSITSLCAQLQQLATMDILPV